MRLIFSYNSKKPSLNVRYETDEHKLGTIPNVGDEIHINNTYFSFVSTRIKNRHVFMWREDEKWCGGLWFRIVKRQIYPGRWVGFDVEPVDKLVEVAKVPLLVSRITKKEALNFKEAVAQISTTKTEQ